MTKLETPKIENPEEKQFLTTSHEESKTSYKSKNDVVEDRSDQLIDTNISPVQPNFSIDDFAFWLQ
jgi:hypothetical protein